MSANAYALQQNQLISNRYKMNEKIKIAFYTRVSTEHSEQLSALDNQISWCKTVLEQFP